MNKASIPFLLFIFSIPMPSYSTQSMISMFLKPYPTIHSADKAENEKISKKLQQPGYLFKKIMSSKKINTGSHGIMSMYLGYVSLSDHDGHVTFPRKQQTSTLNFLVTQGIQPVYMIAPSTINNWMLDPEKPSAMYTFEFEQDQETDLYFFNAKKTDLPKDNMIPLNTIILIAHPKNVFVPEGVTITSYSPNLILPNIYIKKNFDFTYNALYTVSIKQYFEQISKIHEQEEQTIATLMKQ